MRQPPHYSEYDDELQHAREGYRRRYAEHPDEEPAHDSVYDPPRRPRAVYADGERMERGMPNGTRVPAYAPPVEEESPFPWGTVKQSAFGIACALGGALVMRGLDKLAAMDIIGPKAVAPRERTSSVPPRPKDSR